MPGELEVSRSIGVRRITYEVLRDVYSSSSPPSSSAPGLGFDPSSSWCVICVSVQENYLGMIIAVVIGLDLSGPIVDDKALLPAIIVTPSSPSCDRDFRIAFLAAQPKETIATRVITSLHKAAPAPSQIRPRTLILIFVPLLILFCHVLTHHLAMHRPHLHFAAAADDQASSNGPGWFELNDYWDARQARNFIVEESPVQKE
ncbi:hypothetical protein EW145_g10 [Phellinidium pouzarii]|uniref:Uncharacterized protein n=1 Tax=Phellinidium pouzarii TaxID=167371 RepID=A0A4S4LLS1_9AGAM|nr:hypothetical protein EW145_g10 [Phellinidium pouzarii]